MYFHLAVEDENPWTAGRFTTNGKMTVTGWLKLVDSGYTHVWFSSVSAFGDTGSISYWGRGAYNAGGTLEVNTSGTIAKYSSFPILPTGIVTTSPAR